MQLACGVHGCPKKCHKQRDHSNAECIEKITSRCPAVGHTLVYQCSKGPPLTCRNCDREQRLAKEKQRRDLLEQQKRDEEHRAHQETIDKLNAEIEQERKRRREAISLQERALAINQKLQDLENLKNQQMPPSTNGTTGDQPRPTPPAARHTSDSRNPSNGNGATVPSAPTSVNSIPPSGDAANSNSPNFLSKLWNSVSNLSMAPTSDASKRQPSGDKPFKKLSPSPSKQDWEKQKSLQGATNGAIDAMMQMTGLEEVKKKILDILAKIETADRQNVSLKRERFNVTFLGNPGTGKDSIFFSTRIMFLIDL